LSNRINDCKIYIIYGNPALLNYEIIDDKYLVLNIGDNYEDLTNKTLCLLKTTLLLNPEIQGIFKCDDDIIPNVVYLNNAIDMLNRKEIDYMGISLKVNPHTSKWHYNKCSNNSYNVPIVVPSCYYATGPIYYLGIKSIRTLVNSEFKSFFSEDITVGYNLNKHGIEPLNIPMYKNNILDAFQYNFQNIDSRAKTLMVRLHGGLGNQLFQASAGYYLAKKYSFILVL
jgi:hypothetical protein